MEPKRGPSSISPGSTCRGLCWSPASPKGRRMKTTRFTSQNETNWRASSPQQIRRGLIACAYPEAVSPSTNRDSSPPSNIQPHCLLSRAIDKADRRACRPREERRLLYPRRWTIFPCMIGRSATSMASFLSAHHIYSTRRGTHRAVFCEARLDRGRVPHVLCSTATSPR